MNLWPKAQRIDVPTGPSFGERLSPGDKPDVVRIGGGVILRSAVSVVAAARLGTDLGTKLRETLPNRRNRVEWVGQPHQPEQFCDNGGRL